MRKMIRKFPVGTLVKTRIPRLDKPPIEVLGLVISHVEITIPGEDDKCEVFLGPNNWVGKQIVKIRISRLRSLSRPYTKEVR